MAGIGFELQKLVNRDDLLGPARGLFYAAAIVTGPWILTVAAIAIISYSSAGTGVQGGLSLFRTIIIYNFAISLVLSAPIAMITTRFLADRIYDGDETETSAVLIASILIVLAVQFPVPLVIYFLVATISPGLAFLACANYFTVAALWVAIIFLTTLKNYAPVIFSFAVGLLVSTIGAMTLRDLGTPGLIVGFTAGIALTLFMILGRTLGEFRAPLVWPRVYLKSFIAFPALAIAAFAYNAAIWVDKWIFWFSPSFATHTAGLPTYPPYDGAMFYAHLTLVPGLAVFFALVETKFYSQYRRFYWFVQNHGSLKEIEEAQQELIACAASGGRMLLILHLAIAITVLLLAPTIASALSLNLTQIGIFRFAVLGTAAHAFLLYGLILLAYFDLQKRVLMLSILFLVLNAVFTLATQYLGYAYLGAGYFLAALMAATITVTVAHREMARLRYLTFVGNNPATGRTL